MNVLLIGSGGREHAMARALGKSTHLGKLFIAPGNPGTAELGQNVDLDASDHAAVCAFAEENAIDLVAIGPEQPLVDGLTDRLEKEGIKVFGPSREAAQLEGSKAYAKAFMKEFSIPTASYRTFTHEEFDQIPEYLEKNHRFPVVLKASGLAGGKGVFICNSMAEVEERLSELETRFSEASQTLVVEEFMKGEEASVFVISDGRTAKVIGTAQDHKRIGNDDTGLNTGGMGAYSPSPLMTDKMLMKVERQIILPVISGMLAREAPYKGILYVGLMITDHGPKVVEFNCRFGDPECQVILPALQSDLLELMESAADETLYAKAIERDEQYYTCVIMASEGYPLEYEKGKEITGLENISDDAMVFHSGTKMEENRLLTNGGRVLGIVGSGETLEASITKAYAEVEKVDFENAYYRDDIGKKGLKHV